MTRRRTLALCAVVCAAALSGCIIVADDNDSSLSIVNDSDYVLTEIYITEVNDPSWGPDLTGGDVLFPGEEIIVTLDCGDYDVLVVDDTGAECELLGLDLCFEDAVWYIDNRELAICAF